MKFLWRNEIKIFRNDFWFFVMKFKIRNEMPVFPVKDLYSSVINSNFRNESLYDGMKDIIVRNEILYLP